MRTLPLRPSHRPAGGDHRQVGYPHRIPRSGITTGRRADSRSHPRHVHRGRGRPDGPGRQGSPPARARLGRPRGCYRASQRRCEGDDHPQREGAGGEGGDTGGRVLEQADQSEERGPQPTDCKPRTLRGQPEAVVNRSLTEVRSLVARQETPPGPQERRGPQAPLCRCNEGRGAADHRRLSEGDRMVRGERSECTVDLRPVDAATRSDVD